MLENAIVLVGVSQAGLHMSKELLGGKKVKPSSSRVLVTPCQNGKKPLALASQMSVTNKQHKDTFVDMKVKGPCIV